MSVPWARDAEIALVAAALWNGRSYVADLDPEAFWDRRLRRIYAAIPEADVELEYPELDEATSLGLWPYTLPASHHVRIGAVSVLADEEIGNLYRLADRVETTGDAVWRYVAEMDKARRDRDEARHHAEALERLGVAS